MFVTHKVDHEAVDAYLGQVAVLPVPLLESGVEVLFAQHPDVLGSHGPEPYPEGANFATIPEREPVGAD